MDNEKRLLDRYIPPADGFVLESMIATTYQIDFDFFEEELLAAALGVRSPSSRMRAFRSELERRLQATDVTVMYSPLGCKQLARCSPRIDPIPIVDTKQHAKISLLMWIRDDPEGGIPERLIRLIVGSANLTRQGFRQNYECIVSLDYGGRQSAPRALLMSAIEILRRIADESNSPQLRRQLSIFHEKAESLPEGKFPDDSPCVIVMANEVLPRMESEWAVLSETPPEKLTIVSPFWPEGINAADAIQDVMRRFSFPPTIELVCRGAANSTGKGWVPEFDADVAVELKGRLSSRLFLRAALPFAGDPIEVSGTTDDDETEDYEIGKKVANGSTDKNQVYRQLHAKMIILDGQAGSVLYAGSSNCTRRGLGLGGPKSWEAGMVYRLSARRRRQLDSLLDFAGPAIEVLTGTAPVTEMPTREDEIDFPGFLSEVSANGTEIAIRFREDSSIPNDLVLLMPISPAVDRNYRLLYSFRDDSAAGEEVVVDLADCPRCDFNLGELPTENDTIIPHLFIEVRWDGKHAIFPVRFDEKATLPLQLVGRKPTEGELIDYFLLGREPSDADGGGNKTSDGESKGAKDDVIDTRRILAYFIRKFVQAIPGIEVALDRASYSQTALDAALRGPTSPLELAERAFASLGQATGNHEPLKTPIAVGFQLTEILAALLRCRDRLHDGPIRNCFTPAVLRCRELLEKLEEAHPELAHGPFRIYRDRFVGVTL